MDISIFVGNGDMIEERRSLQVRNKKADFYPPDPIVFAIANPTLDIMLEKY